jgi:hypothetical protein
MNALFKQKSTLLFFFACLGLAACNQKSSSHDVTHDHEGMEHGHEHIYACPMHPDIQGHEGEKCSKCGMPLEHMDEVPVAGNYQMEMKISSTKLEAGKSATLSFTPKNKDKAGAVVPLDVEHDKKIHLIAVSEDLNWFDHIHPTYQSSGSYDIKVLAKGEKFTARFEDETRFDEGGNYVLFADYKPTGSTHQLERIPVSVEGTPFKTKKFTTHKATAMVDGYEVSLVPEGGKFVNEGTMHISGIIKKDGKEVTTDQFENYLGAKAHVVMITEDTQDYLHVHPEVVNNRLDLHTTFCKTGVFRAWLQFKTNGQVHTADFTIIVEKGMAPHSEHGHNEKEHSH